MVLTNQAAQVKFKLCQGPVGLLQGVSWTWWESLALDVLIVESIATSSQQEWVSRIISWSKMAVPPSTV
jgi:hypothetical protein